MVDEIKVEYDSEVTKEKLKTMDEKSMAKEPDVLYGILVDEVRRYHPSADISMIEKAYAVAKDAHKEQKRKSGEPYIIHPLCVAIILAKLELDKESIVAGILHDVVEDTPLTSEDVAREFSPEIAQLVDGVTKLTQLNYQADKVELQAENLRKMFLAMANDIRVILIKLADRLHNMRTMEFMKPEKQKEKSRETMDIYAPIAQRLGISKVKIELDDLSLKYLEPEAYNDLNEKIELGKAERKEFIASIIEEVEGHIVAAGISAQISGRVKHLFSIYKKMVNQNKTFDQIYDVFAVRIIVKDVKDCYAALGIIHEMYKPIPGRIKDYIAMPKPNGYQSLHTTLIGPKGKPFEIQIRTEEMHRTAEYGIAAHWKYKANQYGQNTTDNEEAKLTWLRQILEWQRDMSDNKEFLNLIKSDLDLFSENVYAFTPSGDVKNLPNGSTPIDFAYAIHSAVGNKMVGARVNGRLVTIDYKIQNGDRVEILTSQNSRGPSRDWLKLVKSTQAKNKINQWFKAELKEDNIQKGRELINAYCKTKGIVLSEIMQADSVEKIIRKYGFRDWEQVLAAIGHGALKEGQVVNKLLDEHQKQVKKNLTDEDILESLSENENRHAQRKHNKGGIVVKGIDDVAARCSRCCNPVPGDEIIGFVTRGRGVSIHRTDCINILNLSELDRVRLIDAEWSVTYDKATDTLFTAQLKIFANNRVGVLLDITKIFTENKIDISAINVRTSKQGTATIDASFEIKSKEQLSSLIKKIVNVESVIDVERATG